MNQRRPTVLVAADAQTQARGICREAARIAGMMNAHVRLLYVVEFPAGIQPDTVITRADGQSITALELVRDEVRDRFNPYARMFHHAGAEVDVVIEPGEVVSGIWREARAIDATLVFVGSDLVTGFRRLFQRSFTEAVLQEATCPVVVVKGDGEGPPPPPLRSLAQLRSETDG